MHRVTTCDGFHFFFSLSLFVFVFDESLPCHNNKRIIYFTDTRAIVRERIRYCERQR